MTAKYSMPHNVLCCSVLSSVQSETDHDERKHALTNFIVKTCTYLLVIIAGFVLNIHVMAVLQHLQVRAGSQCGG